MPGESTPSIGPDGMGQVAPDAAEQARMAQIGAKIREILAEEKTTKADIGNQSTAAQNQAVSLGFGGTYRESEEANVKAREAYLAQRREAPWADLTTDERLERMRSVVKEQGEAIRRLDHKVQVLTGHMRAHTHTQSGAAVVNLYDAVDYGPERWNGRPVGCCNEEWF